MQSAIRYIVLALFALLVHHGVIDSKIVTDQTINSIVNDIIVVIVPLGAWLWSKMEKKAKSVTLPNGDTAMVLKKADATSNPAIPVAAFALFLGLLFTGCAAFQQDVTNVEQEISKIKAAVVANVPQAWNALSAMWSKFDSVASTAIVFLNSAQFTQLMADFKVSPSLATDLHSALGDANGDVTLSTDLLKTLQTIIPTK